MGTLEKTSTVLVSVHTGITASVSVIWGHWRRLQLFWSVSRQHNDGYKVPSITYTFSRGKSDFFCDRSQICRQNRMVSQPEVILSTEVIFCLTKVNSGEKFEFCLKQNLFRLPSCSSPAMILIVLEHVGMLACKLVVTGSHVK